MPNHKLRALMFEYGDTVRDLAALLHITPEAMSRKLAGKSEFKTREIRALVLHYNLTPAQTWEILLNLDPNTT